tara:strand:+ start:886 stop:2181 length:1296 start_codon:yes stop_codon:yes gene_type:complete
MEGDISLSEARVRYCLYARKSTESDEQQALSIDSQIKEMQAIAERHNLNVVEVKRESHSAKESGKRPIFKELLSDIANEKYNGILTWAPDRLSRNAGDLGTVVDLMDTKKLIHIQTYGQNFSNSPNEKFLLMILCSQAKLENDNKSINVKRGMRARVDMGLWPCKPPTGYTRFKRIDQKCEAILDPERAPMIKQMFEKIGYDGWTGRKLHLWLRDEVDFRTENGKHLCLGNLYRIIQNDFYYGRFEYPKNSGNWYDGVHEPIITRELFNIVQEQIKSQILEPRSQQKEFAFTRTMTCGLCGSGITADEKFEKLKAGGVNRHVYYRCTKSKDRRCKNKALNETDLTEALVKMFDNIGLDQVKITAKLKDEIKKFKKRQAMFLGKKKTEKIELIDVRDYARFVFTEGTVLEQRSVLECVSSELVLKSGQITTK